MIHSSARVALLLFGSGCCALVYQTVWMRELRLVFGASTAASAAVLGVFMGGLGLGSALLGRRADREPNPLKFYATLELLIAISAALSPFLVLLIRKIYFSTGGLPALGSTLATLIRLLLATLVLIVPTFLMGGTLPAAARAIERSADAGRTRLALLYGLNTLGAVAGALLSTFVLIELFGNRLTIWYAAIANVLVAVAAFLLSARTSIEKEEDREVVVGNEEAVPRPFIYAASLIVGFAFLLMELVWYRMLAPLLGGSSFTFGLILAAALFGIGLGGFLYSIGPARPATLAGFAISCGLEAVALAVPFAAGDTLAVVAALLRSLGAFGFWGYVGSWALVTLFVVTPAAIIAGYQFPMLISLLGRGREEVGDHVGKTYAWNTVGAILGSIAGGFGLLPVLSATGTWRLTAAILILLSVAAALSAWKSDWQPVIIAPFALGIVAVMLLTATGPTAAWRHSPIGAGRSDSVGNSINGIRQWLHDRRRAIDSERDGTESSVALSSVSGYAFIVNGKVDGHSRLDGGTQVMSGLIGAILHPNPRRGLVIGLGTGSTAGWLAAVPSFERVDVAELEPAILDVARACRAVNHDALDNPKLHVTIADGREFLLTTKETFDVIQSEPSNPYRAGIASLFTRDFYEIVARKLRPGGLFLQWVQGYEISAETLQTLYASYTSVFPHVETWQTQSRDLLLVGSLDPIPYDAARIREKLQSEPIRSAVWNVWRIDSIEGFLAHRVAGTRTAKKIAANAPLNTDDHSIVEFGFAKTVGSLSLALRENEVRSIAESINDHVPPLVAEVDAERLLYERLALVTTSGVDTLDTKGLSAEEISRLRTHFAYVGDDLDSVRGAWLGQTKPPTIPAERLSDTEARAAIGDEKAMEGIAYFHARNRTEGEYLAAKLRRSQKRRGEAVTALVRAFRDLRSNPWSTKEITSRMFELAEILVIEDSSPTTARVLFDTLRVPLAVKTSESRRRDLLLRLGQKAEPEGCGPRTLAAVRMFEPHPTWEEGFLRSRAGCYAKHKDPRVDEAKNDLDDYLAAENLTLEQLLR